MSMKRTAQDRERVKRAAKREESKTAKAEKKWFSNGWDSAIHASVALIDNATGVAMFARSGRVEQCQALQALRAAIAGLTNRSDMIPDAPVVEEPTFVERMAKLGHEVGSDERCIKCGHNWRNMPVTQCVDRSAKATEKNE